MFTDTTLSDIQHKDSHTTSATSHKKSENVTNKIYVELKCSGASIQFELVLTNNNTDTDYSDNIAKHVFFVPQNRCSVIYL